MYYYAYLNANDIVEQIYDMPAPISGSQWVEIESHDTSLIGKRYNRVTGEFEEVIVFYYAILNDKDIVTGFNQLESQVTADNMIQITAEQYNSQSIMGMWYNRETQTFVTPPVHILKEHTTDEIQYKNEEKWLTKKLDEMDEAIKSSGGGSGTAGENGATFTPYVSPFGDISWTNDKELPNPTSVNIKGPQGNDGAPGANGTDGVPGAKGADGADGISPHIGENGHWYVGDYDTGVPAKGTATGGADGADGITYTPHVSTEGLLTWTNDGGLNNPTPVNLKGATGATGEQGAKGETGTPGTPGQKGETGATGATGAPGANGADGAPGTKGATFTPSVTAAGDLSWTNDKGLTNPASVNIKGPKGDQGETGKQGVKGDPGATGATGATGAPGQQGKQGVQGERGPQGNPGEQGERGAQGYTGNPGPKGDPGDQGPRGYDGADGQDFNGSISGDVLRLSGTQCIYNTGSRQTFGSSNSEHYLVGSKITSSRNIDSLSDARFKNVTELDLDSIRDFASKVKLVSFTFKNGDQNDKHIGVTAQQLISIDSEIAKYFVHVSEDGVYSVDYSSLALLAILALQ